MATTTVRAHDGAEICAEAIGDRGDPAILLLGGSGWSLDWWDDDFCDRLARRGRLVVRYDYRDTGRSTSYPPGAPGYTFPDLVTDAVSVLDQLGIERANLVGLSMGGMIALALALDHRERVVTLTLMATSSVAPGDDGLPDVAPELAATFAEASPEPDWSDRDAVVDHLVDGERAYAGPGNFDEPRMRTIAARVVDRSNDIAAMSNHFQLTGGEPVRPRLGELEHLPTLVLHGTDDPLFQLAHGMALADEIPGARLIELDGVGHELPPARMWDQLAETLAGFTRRS